jgi:hypothetical protein
MGLDDRRLRRLWCDVPEASWAWRTSAAAGRVAAGGGAPQAGATASQPPTNAGKPALILGSQVGVRNIATRGENGAREVIRVLDGGPSLSTSRD